MNVGTRATRWSWLILLLVRFEPIRVRPSECTRAVNSEYVGKVLDGRLRVFSLRGKNIKLNIIMQYISESCSCQLLFHTRCDFCSFSWVVCACECMRTILSIF